MQKQRSGAEELTRKLGFQLAERDQTRSSLESDLKIEREWRTSLQAQIEEYKNQVISLQRNVDLLKNANTEYERLKNSHDELQRKCAEHEQTLEEIGTQLKESKLQVEDMRESNISLKEAVWTSDRQATNCKQCNKNFSVARRKHHCRHCGEIFCNSCSDNTMPLPSSAKPVRVCDICYTLLLQRYSVT